MNLSKKYDCSQVISDAYIAMMTEMIKVETIQPMLPLGTTSPTTLDVIIGERSDNPVTKIEIKTARIKSRFTAGKVNLMSSQKVSRFSGNTGNTS